MLFKNITILDENFAVKSGMYVAVEKERIATSAARAGRRLRT